VPRLRRHALKQIERDRVLRVGWIEVHNVIRPPPRDVVEKVLSQVAVRIEDRDPSTRFDVLQDEASKQRRFARARLSDDVQVLATVGTAKLERQFPSPIASCADVNGVIFVVMMHVPEQAPTPPGQLARDAVRAARRAIGGAETRSAGIRDVLRAGQVMET
jgi:hypothetical protein